MTTHTNEGRDTVARERDTAELPTIAQDSELDARELQPRECYAVIKVLAIFDLGGAKVGKLVNAVVRVK